MENRNFWPQTEHFWLKTTKFHVPKLPPPPSPGGAGVRVPRAPTRCRPGSLGASWESLLVGAVRSGSQDSWVLFPALPLARCEALSDSRPRSVPQFPPLENREKTLLPGLGGLVRVPVTGPCPTGGVCVCVSLSLCLKHFEDSLSQHPAVEGGGFWCWQHWVDPQNRGQTFPWL